MAGQGNQTPARPPVQFGSSIPESAARLLPFPTAASAARVGGAKPRRGAVTTVASTQRGTQAGVGHATLMPGRAANDHRDNIAESLAAVRYIGHAAGPPRDDPAQPGLTGRDHPGAELAYRSEDPTTRRANSDYAEPLDRVVTQARVDRLAADLSGLYGRHCILFEATLPGDVFHGGVIDVMLTGVIRDGDHRIGKIRLGFGNDEAWNRVACHTELALSDKSLPRGTGRTAPGVG